MEYHAVVLTIVLTMVRPSAAAINLANFQQEALMQHNYYRQQLHCTSPMVLNATLSATAQQYANYLAANNIFSHSGIAGYGENMYRATSSQPITSLNGSVPTASWYNEISLYNYNAPGFSGATGHFTQVVWSDSIQLGIGIALNGSNQSAYVVANYYLPGNFANQFAAKVPPLCASTTGLPPASTPGPSMNSSMPPPQPSTPGSWMNGSMPPPQPSTPGSWMNGSMPPSQTSNPGPWMNSSMPPPQPSTPGSWMNGSMPPAQTSNPGAWTSSSMRPPQTSNPGATFGSSGTPITGSTRQPSTTRSFATSVCSASYRLLAVMIIFVAQLGWSLN